MSDLNQVILTGRLTRDPEIRHAPSGTGIANLGLAVDNSYSKDGQRIEKTVFVDAVGFGPLAEFTGRHCFKGQRVSLSGELNLEQWDDKQTGQKRSKISIKIGKLNPIDWKPREEGQNPPQVGQAQAPAPQYASGPADDDDVPF